MNLYTSLINGYYLSNKIRIRFIVTYGLSNKTYLFSFGLKAGREFDLFLVEVIGIILLDFGVPQTVEFWLDQAVLLI